MKIAPLSLITNIAGNEKHFKKKVQDILDSRCLQVYNIIIIMITITVNEL